MGREKKNGPGVATGSHAKDRHKRDRKGNLIDWAAPLPPGLNARLERPQASSKHKSWFEFIENKDKKKKLEFQFTEDRHAPPGFEFVPMGNPALTTACKELSREQGAMIFIVTSTIGRFSRELSFHLNRVGHHIRQSIVEKARESLGDAHDALVDVDPGVPEPIPERQEDIDKQADAAIRDLFPRIPNTDRQMIIQHAFNKANALSKELKNGEPPVGLATDITLSRRVQLAVLAHIRHNHTRYDQLLRETTYVNARKAVEPICLDILVKWRGDEETGRDQLDEILCEVIVISDSGSDDDDDDDDDDEDSSDTSVSEGVMGQDAIVERPVLPTASEKSAPPTPTYRREDSRPRAPHGGRKAKIARKDRRAAMKAHRGFSRYQAARDKAWHQAVERQRVDPNVPMRSTTAISVDGLTGQSTQPWRPAEEIDYGKPEPRGTPYSGEPPRHLPAYDKNPQPNETPREHREHPSHSAFSQPSMPTHGYQPPQHGRASENMPSSALRPIVGPRIVQHADTGVEQVRYSNQDLKDHLVRSIEPYSPKTSQFPTQFPDQPQQHPERGSLRISRVSMEPGSYHRSHATPYGDVKPTVGYERIQEQLDFVTLHEAGRIPAATTQHREALVPLSSQSRVLVRDYEPMELGGSSASHRQSAYRNHAAVRDDGPPLRSGSRPIWIEDDGAIPRSENHPIFIQDDRMEAERRVTRPAQFPPDSRHYPFAGAVSRAHHSVFVDDHSPRQVDPRGSQHALVQTEQDDFVEFVRVSNKFPRRHEPQSIPMETERYEIQSRDPHQSESYQISDGASQQGFQSAPTQYQRIERVVARVEEPVYTQDPMYGIVRQSDGYPPNFQRQERIVGIEYVQTSQASRDVRPYVDQPPVSPYEGAHERAHERAHEGAYEMDQVLYRSRPSSVMPGPYPDNEYQAGPGQSAHRRDRVADHDRVF